MSLPMIAPPCVFRRPVFRLAIFLLTMAGSLTLSTLAVAQGPSPQAPADPSAAPPAFAAQPSSAQGQTKKVPKAPEPQTFQTVCPDRSLFPDKTVSGLRESYQYLWEQDYPAIVFNARDGKSYWLDQGKEPKKAKDTDGDKVAKKGKEPVEPTFVPLTSLFTPVTYTTEKVLVLVCGLHFGATATPVPTT